MATLVTTRREFLVGTGALVVSFSLTPGALAQTAGKKKPVAPTEVDTFLAIARDGTVTMYTGKVDIGTGIRAALPQMVAEELDVRLDRVKMVEGDTALTPDQGPTWGSLSIQIAGVQIRQAAATARKALIELAVQKLGMPSADLAVREGVVFVRAEPHRRVAYGDLIGDQDFNLKVDPAAPLKNPKDYTIVSQPVPRPDIPGKVTGTHTYMHDFRVPGMLHARVVRPPAIGATLERVDEASVRRIKGVKVVRQNDFLAVVAESEWAAVKAARALKATWSKWEGLPEPAKLWEHVRNTPVAKDDVAANVGNAKTAMAGAAKTLKATYDFAIHTHGSMGPACAVADVRDGKAEIWSPSQAPHWLKREVAVTLQMDPANVHIQYLDGAGCYGRNGHEDCTADAALISKLIGKPVRVQWSREDEHGWDPKGPPTLLELRAGLDAAGSVVAWESELWVPKADLTEWPRTLAATHARIPQKEAINPGNIHRNLDVSYPFPNQHSVAHRLASTPFRPSWIRTPGRMQNSYANEAFLDECAAAVGADPVEYRLRHLTDPRGIAVLRAAAMRANWQPRPAPNRDQSGPIAKGRGVAYVKYENTRTYVAGVAEVEVNKQTGAIRCTRFVVAHDCGLIINPDGVRAQVEGNIIQTVSRTLKEEVKWNRSRVTSVDWASYPILRFPEVPEVVIELINRLNEPPWGVGEPAACLPPPAISNAVFDAIGVRLRSVPYTPAKVKAALGAKA
ncbi:MAG: xanthine dehydrogenase family protein molybdopterin-binding subunit [Candidatus Rokubacteria bacterium]|nr:xanthine dehydrogenase family protein molybdopterin-binding subunit [Candidatus Rokubacteria bacterium]